MENLINKKVRLFDNDIGTIKNLRLDEEDKIIDIDFNGKIRSFIYSFAFKKGTLVCLDADVQKSVLEDIENDASVKTIQKTDNKSLFELMDEACAKNSNFNYAKCFWHSTNVNNLIEIYRSKYIQSRDSTPNIPYDNRIKNETSKIILNSHKTKLIFKYARFYFRPGNNFFFNLCAHQKKELVLIGVDRNFIDDKFTKNTPIILFPFSAVNAQYVDLDWHNKDIKANGHSKDKNFKQKEYFNFDAIYRKTSNTNSSQLAECLVYKGLSTYYIKYLYFRDYSVMNLFLSSIKLFVNDKIYMRTKRMCSVNNDMFYKSFYE